MREMTNGAIYNYEAFLHKYHDSRKGSNHEVGPSNIQVSQSFLDFSSNQ